MDSIQTSTDQGETWTDHECGKTSCAWKRVGVGHAVVQVVGYDVADPPEEGQIVLVRIKKAGGELKPEFPLRARVAYRETNRDDSVPGTQTVVFDGAGLQQI